MLRSQKLIYKQKTVAGIQFDEINFLREIVWFN